jgi:hypothetical protein
MMPLFNKVAIGGLCMDRDKPSDDCLAPWMRKSRLFSQWDSIKSEISLHKWYESERAGHDIGWERASTDWMIRHSKKFFDK